MRGLGDYKGDMSLGDITDADIELLLSGVEVPTADEGLHRFVAALNDGAGPPRDPEHMATALAATARASRPATRPRLRRLAILAGAGALVVALGGVAVAADGSVPGDGLYGIDKTLESIGVGNGGVDERIAEFDVLVARGQQDQAYTMLAGVIETTEGPSSLRALHHLELAATKTSTSARSAQEKVAALQAFIEANQGPGGVDGKEFGQGVASIANSKEFDDPDTPESDPDDAPGNSGDAPGQQDKAEKDQTLQEPASDDSPGNSANAPGQQKDKGK